MCAGEPREAPGNPERRPSKPLEHCEMGHAPARSEICSGILDAPRFTGDPVFTTIYRMHRCQAWPRFCTDDVPRSQRIEYWERNSFRTLVALDVADVTDDELCATQTVADLGSLRAICVESNAHVVERPRRLVTRYAKDSLFLFLMLEGSGFLYQGSSCVTLSAGDIVLYDPSRAFIHGFTTAVREVTFDLPAASFVGRFGPWRESQAIRLDGRLGAGAQVSARLTRQAAAIFREAEFGEAAGGPPDAGIDRRAEAIWETVGTVLATVFPERHLSPAERDNLARIKAFARERLSETNLDLDRVAVAFGASTRLVQRRFEATGTCFSEWLRVERLDRAARALADPANLASSITAIAFNNAFVDSAHFCRAFKTRFGTSPRDWRRRALGNTASLRAP